MTQFEYIAIAYSMVLSFTVLRALSVLPHAVRIGRRYWVHTTWVCLTLGTTLLMFWNFWLYREIELTLPCLFLVRPTIPRLGDGPEVGARAAVTPGLRERRIPWGIKDLLRSSKIRLNRPIRCRNHASRRTDIMPKSNDRGPVARWATILALGSGGCTLNGNGAL